MDNNFYQNNQDSNPPVAEPTVTPAEPVTQQSAPVATPVESTQSYNYSQPTQPHAQPLAQPRAAEQNAYYQSGSSYTWTAPQYAPKPPKEKKKGGWGGRILAIVLSCLITATATIGAFTVLVNTGTLKLQANENGGSNIVLNQVVDNNTATPVAEVSGVLTQQEVAEKLIPSVVCIQTYVPVSSFGSIFGYGFEQEEDEESAITPSSQGSGIIYTKDGFIVTNAHVVAGATKIKVITSDGLTHEAELIGADTMTDLAVLKIEAENLKPAEFGSSDGLKVADEVMAIGNPGGIQFNSSVTLGYVSALNREVTSDESGYTMECIQTDAAINPGNSGGALVDMYGYVVGINSSKIVATGYEGLGFAIPIDTAAPIIQNLMDYGYVKDRPMLGISPEYIDSMTARFYGLSEGVYVTRIISDEAEASELEVGDVITAIDGTPVTSTSVLASYIADKKPGEAVTLTVNRAATQEQNLQIELVLSENAGEQSEGENPEAPTDDPYFR